MILDQRYEVGDELGRGGQAVTKVAIDRQTGQRVAVKHVSMRHVEDWKGLELFQREAEVLRALEHPAIPRYVDTFSTQDADSVDFYLVQEYVEGRTLESLWDDHEGFPVFGEKQALRFLAELFEILEYLHGLNPPVVHRDIKPGNIFRRPDGSFALIDFGAVQAILPETMGGSTFVGTSGYMPPEQLMGRAEPRSDIFALGATAVHLLSGFHPGDLPVRNLRLEFDTVVECSAPLRGLLHRMLDPDIARRPTAESAAAEVRRFRSSAARVTAMNGVVPVDVLLTTTDWSDARLELHDKPGAVEIVFSLRTVQPWFWFGMLVTLMTLMTLVSSSATPRWMLVGALIVGPVGIVSMVLGLQRPRLRIGRHRWEFRRRRFLIADQVRRGRTGTLQISAEEFDVNGGNLSSQRREALILSDGLEEELILLGGPGGSHGETLALGLEGWIARWEDA